MVSKPLLLSALGAVAFFAALGADALQTARAVVIEPNPYFIEVIERLRNAGRRSKIMPGLVRHDVRSRGFRWGAPIFMRVFKESSELEVYIKRKKRFEFYATMPICSWSGTLGPKTKQGDQQSPEGFYQVTPRAMNYKSRFHLSFNLGYPNAFDKAHKRTGAHLMIHGNCVSIGCFAMRDTGIETLYALIEAAFRGGQRAFHVHAFPFRMTDENLKWNKQSVWKDFWLNLKEGYDAFERTGLPPKIAVDKKKRRYVVEVVGRDRPQSRPKTLLGGWQASVSPGRLQ